MQDHATVEVGQLVAGRLPGGQQGRWRLEDVCDVVRKLLVQLAIVLQALEPLAYHRDLSSHNVLLSPPDGDGIQKDFTFSLIDFGLAVRSESWHLEWQTAKLGGDPRYWVPGVWTAFAFGFQRLSNHPNPGLLTQYLARMDHFGLGVLALETFFSMWDAQEGSTPVMLEARCAWVEYWTEIMSLFQKFHLEGPEVVRRDLADPLSEGVTGLCKRLRRLKLMLKLAAVHVSNQSFADVLNVCVDLIDERGRLDWSEIPSKMMCAKHD